MQNFVAPKLQIFMEAQWLRVFSLSFDSTISTESVLLIKVHVQSQIVCFKMHQRGNVKKGNMGIGKSFFKSMRLLWAIISHLKITHITHINLKREIIVLILASAVDMDHY